MLHGLARTARTMRVIPNASSTILRPLVRSKITDAASMSELRQFVKDRQLTIKTAGPGRTRDKVLSDIRAVLASETQPTGLAEPGGIDVVTIAEEINPSQLQQQQDQTASNEQSTFSFYLEESALGGEPHPSKLVETTTLASASGPPMTAQLFGGDAPPAGLSNVQLEAIALATQAHDDESALHAQGSRRGLLCGDGTAVTSRGSDDSRTFNNTGWGRAATRLCSTGRGRECKECKELRARVPPGGGCCLLYIKKGPAGIGSEWHTLCVVALHMPPRISTRWPIVAGEFSM